MLPKFSAAVIILLAIGTLGLCMAPPGVTQVYAAPEDVALFQDVLSRYGQWLEHGQHGQVWRPSQVSQSWRPYTNGRWVPTQEGYVFETSEPWGWATYHYGNWLPTDEHGWVWVPGRTWYPHTVNWRTSEENVGWAPVPPPDYTGSDTYYSEGYGSMPSQNTYGSSRYSPMYSAWSFIRSVDFLLGYGLPYSYGYSYSYAGVLVAYQYVPIVYERTVYVNNYVYPRYAPKACYNWGPPVPYLSRVTRVKNIENDHYYKHLRPAQLRNVMPPANLVHRHPAWREIVPNAAGSRQGQIRSLPNLRSASVGLNRPDAIPAPLSLHRQPADRAPRLAGPVPSRAQSPPASTITSQPVPGKMAEPPDHGIASGNNQARRPSLPVQAQDQKTSGTGSRLPYPSVPASTSAGDTARQQPSVTQSPPQIPPPRHAPRNDQQVSQENQRRRQQDHRLHQEQPQALPEAKGRQPGAEIEQQQQMQLEQQRRQAERQHHLQVQQQAELQRQQKAQQQQQRQAEIVQQQQMQQQQQAEKQRQEQLHQQRQAERQQQQVVHQTPPPSSPPPAAPPPHRQKKRDN
jgi:hypothetical protein